MALFCGTNVVGGWWEVRFSEGLEKQTRVEYQLVGDPTGVDQGRKWMGRGSKQGVGPEGNKAKQDGRN